MRMVAAILAGLGLFSALPAHAGFCDNRVGIALVLAIDVSSSIDEHEWQLERDGYAAAFRHPEVINAILHADCGRIAVTTVLWSGMNQQRQDISWRVIDSPEASRRFASLLTYMNQLFARSTHIGGAIRFSTALFNEVSYEPLRKVIDVSGDGIEVNPSSDEYADGTPLPDPYSLASARAAAVAQGVTINGLSIQSHAPEDAPVDIHEYYRRNVISNDGFLVPVEGFQDFARAIRRKLVLEIAQAQ